LALNGCKVVAGDMNTFYDHKYDQIKLDILAAVEEGFREGVREGVKEGLLYALNELIDLQIIDLKKEKVRSLDEILQSVAVVSLESLANSRATHEVCPILRMWLGRQCDQAIQMLTAKCRIKTARDASDLMNYLQLDDLADKKSKEMSVEARKALPSSFIVSGIFNGVYKAMWGCTKESVKKCKGRIEEAAAFA
jgi:hypothetical protein